MARSTFRQGIVRHGKSPGQSFFLQLNSTYVNLLISPDPTIVAIADGTKDYLFTESVTVNNAWGPFPLPSQDYWLYWDIDRVTGIRTYGSTTLTPVYQTTAPTSPLAGQMWFDTNTPESSGMKMYEYNGASWVQVLRVFAGKLRNNQFFSPIDGVSIETNFTGTQIGAAGIVTRNIGSLAFDLAGKPIVNQDGKFFTTEDVFTTGVPSGAALKVNNIIIPAISTENIAAFQVVVFDDYNEIALAAPFDYLDKIYGIVEEDLPTNDVGNVIMEGIIFNENWDFTDAVNHPTLNGSVNDPIYITTTGDLTTDIGLSIPGQIPVGAIIEKQSILFQPGLYGASSTGTAADHGTLTGLLDDDHTQYFDITRGDARYYPQAVVDTLLAERVAIAGDTMTGTLTLNADPTSALEAVTKQYVDGLIGVTYIAGTNITIDGSPTNTISVKDTASGGTVDALTWETQAINVTGSPVPIDNQVLLYNSSTPAWENGFLSFIRDAADTSHVEINTTTGAIEVLSTAEAITLTSSNVVVNPTAGNGTIILNSGSYGTTLAAPSLADNTQFILPSTNGSAGQVLSTNGSGVTSWIPAASGGSSYCLMDADGDTYVEVGAGASPKCQDSGSNAIRIQTGATGSGTASGAINIATGYGTNATSGNINITTGDASGAVPGSVDITAGTAYSSGYAGGSISITAGTGNYTAGNGGGITIKAGTGSGNAYAVDGSAGDVTILSGDITSKDSNQKSGDIYIRSPYGAMKTGDIYLSPGATYTGGSGADSQGSVRIQRFGYNAYHLPDLRFYEAAENDYVSLVAPFTIAENTRITLPVLPNEPSNIIGQVMSITTAGLLPDGVSNDIVLDFSDIPYDLAGQGFGILSDGDVIMRFIVPRAFVLLASGHLGYAVTAPAGSPATSAVFDVLHQVDAASGTTNIGTLTFAPGSKTPTLSGFSLFDVSAGNIISIVCTTANAIEDVTITLIGRVGTT